MFIARRSLISSQTAFASGSVADASRSAIRSGASHGLLSEVFGDDLPPEPEQPPLPVIHAWTQ